jgi:hypothetical protein
VTGLDARLVELVRSSDWLMAALRAVRDVDPPDWLVGGGVLRDLVWDRLHGRAEPGRPRDVDLAFFDPHRLDPGRDAEVERALVARVAGLRLRERWGGWRREPFTAASTMHVSVYEHG